MRYLVTGGAGFIGSNLVDHLIGLGHEVFVWDNCSTGKWENLNSCCIFSPVDISTASHLDVRYDGIFHLAALPRIQLSFEDPQKTFSSNITGTINLLEAVRNQGYKTPVVFAGSSTAYDDTMANPYTFSKWFGECCCYLYNSLYGIPTKIARFFNVYGPRQSEDQYATVVGVFNRQKREGTPLTITGDGEQRRDFIHVGDIVRGLVAIMNLPLPWTTEHIGLGSGVNYSINELAAIYESPVTYIPARPGEARESLANPVVTLMNMTQLDWFPKMDLVQYIKSAR